MFSLVRNLYRHLKTRKEKKVTLVILGVDNAGKTTLLKGVHGSLNDDVAPTAGFNTETMKEQNVTVTLFDVGGGPRIRGIWPRYYSEVFGIIFMIDSSDPSRFPDVANVLEEVLKHKFISGKPILFLANKQDLPESLSPVEVDAKLRLSIAASGSHRVQPCTALIKEAGSIDPNLKAGMKWLLDTIKKDYDSLAERVEVESAEQQEIEKREKEERRKRVERMREERRRRQEEEERKKQEEAKAAENGEREAAKADSSGKTRGGEAVESGETTPEQTRKEAALRAHEEEEEQQRTPRPDASARPPLPRRTTREGWAEEEPKEAKESEREGRASQSASNREGSQQRRQSFSKNKIVPVSSETKAEAEAGTVVELSVVAGSNADAAAPSNDRAPGLSGRRGSTGSFEQTKSAPEAPALSLPHSMSQGELSGGGVPLRERQEKGTGRSLEKLDTSGLGAGAAATTVAAAGGRRLPPLRREREDGDDRPKEAATPSLLHFSTSQEEIVVSAATEEVGRKTETAEKSDET